MTASSSEPRSVKEASAPSLCSQLINSMKCIVWPALTAAP